MDPDAKDDDDKTAFDFIKSFYFNQRSRWRSFLLPSQLKLKN